MVTNKFVLEMIGTCLLIILGDGVVAALLLSRSKAQNAGWIVITWGWAMAVMVGVFAAWKSGAHINPAVTIAFAVEGTTKWADVPQYLGGQFLGAFLGGVIVYLTYLTHWAETEDPGLKLAVFCTGPAIRNTVANLITEIVGTAVLVFGVQAIFADTDVTRVIGPLLVGLLVLGIGLSLGGPTGYAINPARDLGPRIAHAVLPISGKGSSDWSYSWIPVVGPVIGGVLGGLLGKAVF